MKIIFNKTKIPNHNLIQKTLNKIIIDIIQITKILSYLIIYCIVLLIKYNVLVPSKFIKLKPYKYVSI